ncbi:hypothetical protein GCM10020001_115360 [Nonomuraea salmonea]
MDEGASDKYVLALSILARASLSLPSLAATAAPQTSATAFWLFVLLLELAT